MTHDAGADSAMPTEIDGKRVISAFRRMPAYGKLAYTYIVIVDEATRDDDGMNMYTVGVAVYELDPGALPRGRWTLTEPRRGMPNPAAMREFAQMAYHAANRARSDDL
jgi:hypothetical protein